MAKIALSIESRVNELSNGNVIDAAAIRDLERAMESEAPPPLDELESIYAEAGVTLPGVAIRRYDEVRSFHESVVRNRRDYLSGELDAAKQRIADREKEKQHLDTRRAEVMKVLQTHGALDQFSKLQAAAARKEADVELLYQRFEAAEQLEGTKNELDIERNRLTLRLRRDFAEQKERLPATAGTRPSRTEPSRRCASCPSSKPRPSISCASSPSARSRPTFTCADSTTSPWT